MAAIIQRKIEVIVAGIAPADNYLTRDPKKPPTIEKNRQLENCRRENYCQPTMRSIPSRCYSTKALLAILIVGERHHNCRVAPRCPTSTRSPIFLPMQSWPIQLHRLRIN